MLVQVLNMAMPLVAATVTSFRLYCRARQGRLWIDDLWATFAMLSILTLTIANWIYMEDYGEPRFLVISILLTVVRLTAPGTLRKILMRTTAVFFILWAVLSAQVLWTCEDEPNWKTEPRPQCSLGKNVAIAQIITDVFGDTVLILAPFRLIYKVRLTKAQKIRILAIFSTSITTTVVSLVHAYYILSDEGLNEAMAAMVETSVSLIVANLSVVVAFFLRMSAKDDTPSPVPWQSSPVITIGSLPIRRHRFNDPLATTAIGIDTTTIRLTNLPETCPSALKSDNMDEISLNNIEGKQGGGELWEA
ncbi:uncharacterized protein HD556DRAFT_1249330 [Suillus plorans]|uniref:Rhodopsin domain-containing protein n=1 Tax=Suillus plorans TaxID=116603 RepID=A0A9P7DAP8_9AGAM|nr:uncharacterized protein HD556DRAFT_1249330 [Suillus plorans]KAG1785744.1 hypothetical protein HD556DRAFT_1249330 [Suillus plorans]